MPTSRQLMMLIRLLSLSVQTRSGRLPRSRQWEAAALTGGASKKALSLRIQRPADRAFAAVAAPWARTSARPCRSVCAMPRCRGAISNVSSSKLTARMPSVGQMGEVDVEGLLGHQVHGRRGAAEGVQHKDVEALRLPCACSCRSSTSRPSPSRTSVVRLAVLQEGEVPVDEIEHRRIELVVAHDVARAPERRDHAGAEPDDADAQRGLGPPARRLALCASGEAERRSPRRSRRRAPCGARGSGIARPGRRRPAA